MSIESAGREPGGANGEDLLSGLARQGRQLLADGADGVVLACAGFGQCREPLAAALEVPVCDGIGVGACLAAGRSMANSSACIGT